MNEQGRNAVSRVVGGGTDSKPWFPNWFLIWSIKEAGSQLLGGRDRWDFQVSGGKGDKKREGDFSARLWNEQHTAIM